MSRLPRLTGAEVIAALALSGFVDARVKAVIMGCATPTAG